MGMPMELNTMIVTKGKEERIDENIFQITKEGYRIYPLHIPMEVRKIKHGEPSGTAIVEKLVWEDNQTLLYYRLLSLHTTN